jgi:diguanylate cyclase (GGDEF)-like protein/PAS domain S-box-containing protein
MPEDHAGNSSRAILDLTELKHALAQDWAARRFRLEYQQQINLRSRRIVRFEALLRWDRGEKTLISPNDFIPLAEELGLIFEIGQWVLERACADAVTWQSDIGVAVNVSAICLRDPALTAMVGDALAQTRLQPSRLELEITESAAIIMDPASLGILHAIQNLGVRITIDDLDAGHASLQYLLHFPFDKVKLDAVYAAALTGQDWRAEAARGIIHCVAGLCNTLNIDSLAEGVETQAQLAVVMDAGFTEVQGYIFGAPVAAGKIPQTILRSEEICRILELAQPEPEVEFSFSQVADAVNDIIVVTTAQIAVPGPVITYVNPAFTRLTGFTAEEVIGKTPRILQGPGSCRTALEAIRTALGEGRTAQERILNYTKGGAPYWLDIRIEPLRDASGTITHFISIQRDVTLDKRRLDELEYVVDRDILTGISNRRAFLKVTDFEIELCRKAANTGQSRPLCVAWIDVDRFKTINDNFGHATGDAVLFRVADRLTENTRRADAIGRLGGDEFAVCMPEIGIEDANGLAERLCHAVAAGAIETMAGSAAVTVSIGIAELAAADDVASLMARADEAMYDAKRRGGNRVCNAPR